MQDLKSQRTVESDSSWHFVGAQCDRADPLDHGQNSPVFISLRDCSRHFSTGQNKAECCAPKRTSAKIAHAFYEYTPWLGVARIQPSSKSSLMWRCSSFFLLALAQPLVKIAGWRVRSGHVPEGEPDLVWLQPDHRCQE